MTVDVTRCLRLRYLMKLYDYGQNWGLGFMLGLWATKEKENKLYFLDMIGVLFREIYLRLNKPELYMLMEH